MAWLQNEIKDYFRKLETQFFYSKNCMEVFSIVPANAFLLKN